MRFLKNFFLILIWLVNLINMIFKKKLFDSNVVNGSNVINAVFKFLIDLINAVYKKNF
jgi:hypothetical protein